MNLTTLSKKIKKLPPDKQQQVEDFVNFLGSQYGSEERGLADRRKANRGMAKGVLTISDDFDEPLEDFDDYM
jgi:mRNA-degrading endonuclease RelE of RelBE toxin-antitoxin system